MNDDDMAECRCVTCGERFRAEDYPTLHEKYTNHQVDVHGKSYKSDNV